jgi:hypothetical protein
MGEPLNVGELTAEERHAIVLLRHGPQSLHGLAETLGLNPEQTQNVLQGVTSRNGKNAHSIAFSGNALSPSRWS